MMAYEKSEIDDSLYSRQLYVLGDTAMKMMANSSVLLYGLGGLGVEIAKNLVLTGIKSLTLVDDRTCSLFDVGSNFFITEDDVVRQCSRSQASRDPLSELNPYVLVTTLQSSIEQLAANGDLTKFQCIILTEASLQTMKDMNHFCRSQTPSIKFLCGDVCGLLASAFCDFGPEFEVIDKDGEELKQCLIGGISKSSPGVVTTFDKTLHGLQTGDFVIFKEIQGMCELNNQISRIKVLSPYSFSICDTDNGKFSPYLHSGMIQQICVPNIIKFSSLQNQLFDPQLVLADLCRTEAPANLHVSYLTIKELSCNKKDSEEKTLEYMIDVADDINRSMRNPVKSLDHELLNRILRTFKGVLPPLCTALGGILAQECLKAITGKFTPLSQWLHFDVTDLLDSDDWNAQGLFTQRSDRYDCLRMCIGDEIVKKLSSTKLFMVGCGAIGCELLKNFALLGIGCHPNGQVTITDHDLIEKSNLNRQFLFRARHIRQSKSVTAASSVKQINRDVHIDALQYLVCSDTESSHFTDKFFENQSICINALDNVEARRYMDGRCVSTERPLIDTGTMGPKGHVQVIVPHVTETYRSQSDPVDHDVPYCTLKSFPSTIEHCIQWARDKFESSFTQKPNLYNKFWTENENAHSVIEALRKDVSINDSFSMTKILASRPLDWSSCVQLGRRKFEKYFNHKARQLLHCFPLESKLSDNITLFWQSPKRPPTPVLFDIDNSTHLSFVLATAKLYADRENISYTSSDFSSDALKRIIYKTTIQPFMPSSKVIETSPDAKKPAESVNIAEDTDSLACVMESFIESNGEEQIYKSMNALSFEKDDDSNGHIDFMTAAANIRAEMYNIDCSDRLTVKRIAGRIIPAIATTTAAVAGLATIELIKVIGKRDLSQYRNAFLNLALPAILLSEPGPVKHEIIRPGLSYTMWDKWHVHGNAEFTLSNFVLHFYETYHLTVSLVVYGVKLIYTPDIPQHNKRLKLTMVKLLKPTSVIQYVDLVVSFMAEGGDVASPPVRYHFR